MFNDIGALELVALVVLAVLVFGPDKLPKVIQDTTRFIRKIREFSDNAKQDIRSELGPEFKDFEFEDLNPKTYLRKQFNENDELRELKELTSSFDLRKEMNEVAGGIDGKDSGSAVPATVNGSGTPDLLKKADRPARPDTDERPPYDSDAT
ncbi:sec-independent translocase [Streptomyces yaizuensis]|uniref:Sec-independent protein translocase protein TatB n=1 Tax=Streptomyces yaizuensis TaxID=2989713 RepID=A0ABQ5NVW8_9ACTN|nr:sec-independent translocase [Streptomyces sp. YSPA8]GLF94486.1 Sec-independent protein translocase subunit TatB [Streptomyces sp. YSPA8]